MGGLDGLLGERPKVVLERLEALAVRARRGEEVTLPSLTLLLLGGHAISGRFVAFDPERGGAIVLEPSETRGAQDALYAGLESLVAIIVHHHHDSVAALSGGAVAPRPAEIPGRLVLARRAQAFLPRPVEVDWSSLGQGKEACAAVALTLDALEPTLASIVADSMGRAAFEQQVERIQLVAGSEDQLAIEGRRLVITLRRAGSQVFPVADLMRRLPRLL